MLAGWLLTTATLSAAPGLATLSGGPTQFNPSFSGFEDGNTTTVAQFNSPWALALNNTATLLYAADRDNDAVRLLYLNENLTTTFATQGLNKPVGVAVDGAGNVYVLNQGNGSNGSLLKFDSFGYLLATLASGLINAAGLALDPSTNAYVTFQNNRLARITPGGVQTTVATVTNAGASLKGIVVADSGHIAACDAGRHGILLINPNTGAITNLSGFNGAGDAFGTKNNARFMAPAGISKAGGDLLIVADSGNHRVKIVNALGTVTNLYGVKSNFWYTGSGSLPGWWDGTVCTVDQLGCPEARLPMGLAFAPNGDVYSSEVFYHLIRKTTSTGLPPPPPPPTPVATPRIGWVDFTVPPATVVSVLRLGTSFVFNNDVTIAIDGTAGTETHYTFGSTPVGVDTIPDPTSAVGSTPPIYNDGMFPSQVPPSIVLPQPDVTIKAISFQSGRPDSAKVTTRFEFKTASPVITGNNAALFTVSGQTVGAQMWYTIDGTDPTNRPPSLGPVSSPANLSFNINSNTTFKIRAFRDNYQLSAIAVQVFSATNFNANKITFGFSSGEASSDFVASPGQLFYAPVTLSTLPTTRMYSLQFNITVTNVFPAPAVLPGDFRFESMLVKPDPRNPGLFVDIPPAMFVNYTTLLISNIFTGTVVTNLAPNFTNLVFQSQNLLGVGWLERFTKTNLYDTALHDLIKYSLPHDTLFDGNGGKIVPGGYAFRVPGTAAPGSQYRIQLGRPSATSDGVGAPGSDVVIETPTTGSLSNGAINSIKIVTVGQRKYVVGDAAPFRWFNAGDFGNSNLLSDDVMQVFQSAIYSLNYPPAGSDFFDGMDSCCGTYTVAAGTDYLVQDSSFANDASRNPLFDGNDLVINSIAFGDGALDIADIYVTFRRSLDPSLQWFRRFWTNGNPGARVAQFYPNQPPNPPPLPPPAARAVAPAINFVAGDGVAVTGQTIVVPITATIQGSYPLRLLGLGITVEPLDGSPAITTPVQFTPNNALGAPTVLNSRGAANYAAAWLNRGIAGLSGDAVLGTLQVTLPATSTSNSAYAIHFDHASGSPNGLVSFPRQTRTGLITRRDRSASSFGDGIPDSWRLRYFGTLNNVLSQASADADGDGATNDQEYRAGTDPNDASSVLRLKSKAGQPQECSVHWPSVSGRQYVIERAASLHAPAWTPVSTNSGTGWDMEYRDTGAGAGPLFYRVRVLP